MYRSVSFFSETDAENFKIYKICILIISYYLREFLRFIIIPGYYQELSNFSKILIFIVSGKFF